jgi:hypothetical protein
LIQEEDKKENDEKQNQHNLNITILERNMDWK